MNTLHLDIETSPQCWWLYPHFRMQPPAHAVDHIVAKGPKKNIKDPAKIAEWKRGVPQAAADWYQSTSLDPRYGMILCAGVQFGDGAEAVHGLQTDAEFADAMAWRVDSEKVLLERLLERLEFHDPSRIVTFNGEKFDLPFLWQRAMYWKMPRLARWFVELHYSIAKNENVVRPGRNAKISRVDIRKLWQHMDYRLRPGTLPDIDFALTGHQHDDIPGSEVLTAMIAGLGEKVLEHVVLDVERLERVWPLVAAGVGIKVST